MRPRIVFRLCDSILGNSGLVDKIFSMVAKRLLTRLELVKVVGFDFEGVETIGQAFADQIFRVFANEHPGIELVPYNANFAGQAND